MITLLSPSKGQNFQTTSPCEHFSTPFFINRSEQLIHTLKSYSCEDIRELMGVSENIANLNIQRFNNFSTPFHLENSKQAIFSFTGDVYSKINALNYSGSVLDFAQNHLRILSGLYGTLRPLDLIQPYRLEMKTKLVIAGSNSLYQYWGEEIQEKLSQTLQKHTNRKIINLASNEYFKVIRPKKKLDIITINFKEIKNNKARVIAIFAKRARGLMANYIMQHRVDDDTILKNFTEAGYRFSVNDSSSTQFTFTRPQPEPKSKW